MTWYFAEYTGLFADRYATARSSHRSVTLILEESPEQGLGLTPIV